MLSRRETLGVHGLSTLFTEKRHAKDAEGGEHGAEGPSQEGTPVPSDNQLTPNAQTAPLPSRISLDDGGNDTGMEMDDPQSVSAMFPGGKGSAFAARDANPPRRRYQAIAPDAEARRPQHFVMRGDFFADLVLFLFCSLTS